LAKGDIKLSNKDFYRIATEAKKLSVDPTKGIATTYKGQKAYEVQEISLQ
jgi:hypothetical protein